MKFIVGRQYRPPLAESAVEYGRLAADVVHMLGEAGGARNNLQHVAGSPKRRKKPSRKRI